MPDERAFTRRQPGVNPIALELDRLAEQQALRTLGTGRQPSPATAAAAVDADRQRAAYTSVLDRIRSAPGREGEADVLGQIPDDELAAHAQQANAEMDDAIARGTAYVTKDGDLYTRDPNLNFSPHLALVHEHEAREAAQPTQDDPSLTPTDLGGDIRSQIAEAKRMIR